MRHWHARSGSSSAVSLQNLIAIYMVAPRRIILMTWLGRAVSNLAAEVIFTEADITMLRLYSRNYRLIELTDLASAIKLVAMMGGYMNRKHDPPPSTP